MPYLYQLLEEHLKHFTVEGQPETLTVSAQVPKQIIWDTVTVGGKITRIAPDLLHPTHMMVEIDDDVSTVSLYVIEDLYRMCRHAFQIGNVIVARGHVITKQCADTTLFYVTCISIRLVTSLKTGGVSNEKQS